MQLYNVTTISQFHDMEPFMFISSVNMSTK